MHDDPTDAELDRIIAEQRRTMPRWWESETRKWQGDGAVRHIERPGRLMEAAGRGAKRWNGMAIA